LRWPGRAARKDQKSQQNAWGNAASPMRSEWARRAAASLAPHNRLVAGELEALWEAALRHRDQLRRERAEFDARQEQLRGVTVHPIGKSIRPANWYAQGPSGPMDW
jgi:hypothetical protein